MKKKEAENKQAKSDARVDVILENLVKKGIRVCKPTDSDSLYLLRRPSGVFSLDLHTAGGLPAGCMAEIAGPEGIGKNLLANYYIAECQRIYGDDARIFVAVTEYKYDKDFARKCGVIIPYSDTELKTIEKDSGWKFTAAEKEALTKKVGEFIIIQQNTAEKTFQAVLECLKSNEFQIGILDSLGAMAPETEVDKDLESASKVGSTALLQTRFMQKFYPAIGDKTTFIILNQVRAAIGGFNPFSKTLPVDKYKIPTSFAIKHGLIARLLLTFGGDIQDESGKILGKKIRWEIIKGKAGFHEGPNGIWLYYYDYGIDKFYDVVETLVELADKKGSYLYLFDKDFHGRPALVSYLRENPDEIEVFKKRAFELKKIQVKWK